MFKVLTVRLTVDSMGSVMNFIDPKKFVLAKKADFTTLRQYSNNQTPQLTYMYQSQAILHQVFHYTRDALIRKEIRGYKLE